MTLLTDVSVRRSLDRLKAVPEYQVKLVMANLEEPEGPCPLQPVFGFYN